MSDTQSDQRSDSIDELQNMIYSFRVAELQMLLGHAGKNKTGRKTELQKRALELLRVRHHPIHQKIRDLFTTIQSTIEASQAGGVPTTTNQQQQQSIPVANAMSQQQQNNGRNTATVHPFVDSRMQVAATRQAAQAAAAAIYNQNQIQNMYFPQYTAPKPNQLQIASNFPIHPDVRFKRLPFYDIIADLIKPSSLVPQTNSRMQEQPFYFHLTPQQATDIASSRDIRPGVKCDYVKQVQLRFALLETTCEQEDCFPPQVMVKVNNKLCPLPNPIPTNKPGVEPKRPPRPVNITPMVKLSPTVGNQITVSWAADYGRGFALTVALVHKLTSSDLLQRLKNKGAKHADHTKALIKEKLNDDGDCEIATTSLRVSLMCPLGKMRMTTPCRPNTCSHLQCFDASLFLQMNERKPTWNCPVCDKPALYDTLVIDGYFQEVLNSSLPGECNEIQLLKDGSWSAQNPEKKAAVKAEKITTSIAIDDSIEIIEDNDPVTVDTTTSSTTDSKPKEPEPPKKREVVDLTLSDSDDDEPLAKKRATAKADSTIKSAETQSISSGASDPRSTPGPSSVTSSGYPASPGVINLDSPSPPSSPQPPQITPQQSNDSSCVVTEPAESVATQQQQNENDISAEQQDAQNFAPSMPFLDLENEATGNVNFGDF